MSKCYSNHPCPNHLIAVFHNLMHFGQNSWPNAVKGLNVRWKSEILEYNAKWNLMEVTWFFKNYNQQNLKKQILVRDLSEHIHSKSTRMPSTNPSMAAMYAGLQRLCSWPSGSAPATRRSRMQSRWRFLTATNSGVCALMSATFTSAPCRSNTRTQLAWPAEMAMILVNIFVPIA